MRNTSCLLLLLGLILFSCDSPESEDGRVTRPVRYQKVRQVKAIPDRIFTGIAHYGIEAKLSFRVDGKIDLLPVKLGSLVQKGDVIAKLDPRDFELQVDEAKATLLQKEAAERNAIANYNRIRELYETRSASRTELDAARAEAESASASVQVAMKKLELADTYLGYSTLTAPISGAIASVHVEVNENIKAGQPIVLLTKGEELEVKLDIPEVLIALIKKGQSTEVRFAALPEETFIAHVTEVGVSTGEGTTTYPVTVKLQNSSDKIRSGMAAEAFFSFDQTTNESAIFIPAEAVLDEDGEQYTFVVVPTHADIGVIEKRKVTPGYLSNAGLEITSGLEEGELVVTAGIHFLENGIEVRIPEKQGKN